MRKRVIIVGININNKNNFEESIIELKNLCIACDIEIVGEMEQNLKKINPTFYMGSGKIEELRDLIDTITTKTLAGEIDQQTSVNLLSDLMATNMMDRVEKPVPDKKEEPEEEIEEEEIATPLLLY